MIVPEYWAEARIQTREDGKQITVRRFGWSDSSMEEAEATAQERAAEAMKRLRAGEKLDRREFKVPYNGADGVPIREEILARHGDAVITRNSYGAPCLNTPDVFFSDVDFADAEPDSWGLAFKLGTLLSIGALINRWEGLSIKSAISTVLICFLIGSFAAYWVKKAWVLANGGLEMMTRKRIEAFVAKRPDWNLRLYRTPAGYRLLALHRLFKSDDPAVEEVFRELPVDRMYAQMCHHQRCFRARLGPKPWRIGINVHMRPRPGVWPVRPESLAKRTEWVAGYEHIAKSFASCQFVTDLGSGVVDPKVESVAKLHDELSRAHSGLEMA